MTPGPEDPEPPFTMVPLGPFTDPDGRWCCGLHCCDPGLPCPYGMKLKPGWRTP